MNAIHTAYIALGSNLGDRSQNMGLAVEKLRARGIQVEAISKAYDTIPVGGPPGTEHLHYLNAAACLRTALPPRALLAVLLEVERELGRSRTEGERNAPRSIDLDLLLYDDQVEGWAGFDENSPREPQTVLAAGAAPAGFCLPHPRMHLREFVLKPLAEIAPQARHPVLGKTISKLLVEAQQI